MFKIMLFFGFILSVLTIGDNVKLSASVNDIVEKVLRAERSNRLQIKNTRLTPLSDRGIAEENTWRVSASLREQ